MKHECFYFFAMDSYLTQGLNSPHLLNLDILRNTKRLHKIKCSAFMGHKYALFCALNTSALSKKVLASLKLKELLLTLDQPRWKQLC